MQEKSNCSKCNKTGPGKVQIGMIIFGFYLLFSSVYGTYHLIKELINFFN